MATRDAFYPNGVENLPPPLLHFLHVGKWATANHDYWRHRNSPEGVVDHTVVWLHTARHRDRFVFMVFPVEYKAHQGLWGLFWSAAYGCPPMFAFRRGKLRPSDGKQSVMKTPVDRLHPVGVEIVEVMHRDITAMDYCSGLTGSRLALEVQSSSTRWFPSQEAACKRYGIDSPDIGTPSQASIAPMSHATGPLRTPHSPKLVPLPLGPAMKLDEAGESIARQRSIHMWTHESDPFEEALAFMPSPPLLFEEGVVRQVSGHGFDFVGPSVLCTNPTTHPVEHKNTMVIAFSQDPNFNAILREVLMPEGTPLFCSNEREQKRLLKLYEAGMPSWTMFSVRWGLPYRRWVRLVSVTIVNLWPIIALGCGLYDIYKNMPFISDFLQRHLQPLSLWMDEYVSLRISMFVAYLVSITVNTLHQAQVLVRGIGSALRLPFAQLLDVFSALRYVLSTIVAPAFTLMATLWHFTMAIFSAPVSMVRYGTTILSSVRPLFQVAGESAGGVGTMWEAWFSLWSGVLRPMKNMLKAIYDSIVHVGVAIVRREESLRRGWREWRRKLVDKWQTRLDKIVSFAADITMWCIEDLSDVRMIVAVAVLAICVGYIVRDNPLGNFPSALLS